MIELILEQIAKDIKNKLDWLRHQNAVKSHQGEFTVKDLEAIALTAPCVRFTYNGLSEIKQASGGQVTGEIELVAILVANDCELKIDDKKSFYRKDEIITMMLDDLLPFLTMNSFGIAGMQTALKPKAKPVYRGESSGSNIVIWSLTWSHKFMYTKLAGQEGEALRLIEGDWEELKR